ncbi:VOC family protein [Nonomuraea antimicrobica]
MAEPTASKTFYAALGMTVDRDYGNKYVDFHLTPGCSRLGLLPRATLAKDAGIGGDGAGFRAVVLHHRAGSRAEVDAILAAAHSAGGRIAVAAGEGARGGYSGHFADPDGHLWRVSAA